MKKKTNVRNVNGKEKRPHVVTLGGGTGSFVLLSGLKEYPVSISAIVAMADDGGSTGVLRDEMGVLPPGDVRSCLAALSRATPEVRALFNYRFENSGLKGHSFGNLFLSALEKTTGSFTNAVAVAGRILNVYGRVIPVTEGDMRLKVILKDDSVIFGENKLDDDERVRAVGVASVSLEKPVAASAEALAAIESADLAVLGPGDLYSNLIPSLLVDGVADAFARTRARLVFVANITNKKGLTEGYTAEDYAHEIEKHLRGRRIDVLVFNTKAPDPALVERYEEQEGENMMVTLGNNKAGGRIVKTGDFLDEHAAHVNPNDKIAATRSFIRHASVLLARAVIECLEDGKRKSAKNT
ncbi:MAG: uridine diphosphate-N-acetylglucosamine-binding protein YvcK [bacterium]|nr:uridine diphosphate-N-acetylglucosamine-binding protein YvcK [bacterium]